MWYFDGGMGWWMVFGGIIMVLFWGMIIALVVWGTRKLMQRESGSSTNKRSPIDIAKERYAKGEISKEEFEQIKSDIR